MAPPGVMKTRSVEAGVIAIVVGAVVLLGQLVLSHWVEGLNDVPITKQMIVSAKEDRERIRTELRDLTATLREVNETVIRLDERIKSILNGRKEPKPVYPLPLTAPNGIRAKEPPDPRKG